MSINWAERERDTNKLVRAIASHVLKSGNASPKNIFGIAKLAWITNSKKGDNLAYIKSTKIPALGDALGVNFSGQSLEEVALKVEEIIGTANLSELVQRPTGFTNFYNAYRNSVKEWTRKHHAKLLDIFIGALQATSKNDRRVLIAKLDRLPGIPKAKHPEQLMRAECFVTPALFALDPEILFPLINGNEWVQNVLASLDVTGSSLVDQFDAMSEMIGQSGISDAADLDQVGRAMGTNAVDFVRTSTKEPTKGLLTRKDINTDRPLPLKDEADVEVISKSGTKINRRVHNELTNAFRDAMGDYLLVEGISSKCMFDVLVKNYDGVGNDLLIEAKSSIESANIRMAVGQLYQYWYVLIGNVKKPHLAVLLPSKPAENDVRFLLAMNIGLLWFENGLLVSLANKRLAHLANER